MTIVKAPNFEENEVINLVRDIIPTSKIVGNIGSELSYILDHESASTFKDLFACFEGSMCLTFQSIIVLRFLRAQVFLLVSSRDIFKTAFISAIFSMVERYRLCIWLVHRNDVMENVKNENESLNN